MLPNAQIHQKKKKNYFNPLLANKSPEIEMPNTTLHYQGTQGFWCFVLYDCSRSQVGSFCIWAIEFDVFTKTSFGHLFFPFLFLFFSDHIYQIKEFKIPQKKFWHDTFINNLNAVVTKNAALLGHAFYNNKLIKRKKVFSPIFDTRIWVISKRTEQQLPCWAQQLQHRYWICCWRIFSKGKGTPWLFLET